VARAAPASSFFFRVKRRQLQTLLMHAYPFLCKVPGFDSKAVSISVGNVGHNEQVRLVLNRQVKYLAVCMTLFRTLRAFQLTVIHNS